MGQTDLRPKGTPVDTLNADGTWDRLGSIALIMAAVRLMMIAMGISVLLASVHQALKAKN